MPRHPRRPRPTRSALALVALALLFGASACGGTDPVDKETFQTELMERTNPEDGPVVVPEAVAGCLTDKIFDEFDQAEVDRIYRAATPTELDDDVEATLTQFNQECFQEFGPPVAEDGETTTEDEGSTTSTGDDSTTTTAGSEDATTTSEG